MKSPFKFLDSYTLSDRNIFFGRDQEITRALQEGFREQNVTGLRDIRDGKIIACELRTGIEV